MWMVILIFLSKAINFHFNSSVSLIQSSIDTVPAIIRDDNISGFSVSTNHKNMTPIEILHSSYNQG